MTALTIVAISGELLVIATVIGNPFRVFLLRHLDIGTSAAPELKWLVSLFTGIAVLPLTLLWLGLLPGLVSPPTILSILFLFLAANLVIYRRQLLRLTSGFPKWGEVLPAQSRWFLGLFLAILAFQMLGLSGLFVTPGDDAKLYSLISQRFIEVNGIPGDWGTYAPSGWFIERTHLLLPGFSSIVAFLVPISGFDVPTLVSVLSSLFRILTASSLYCLVWVFTRRRIPSLLAMFVYGFLILEPAVNWFTWGGMAELSSISLLPVAAAGTFLIGSNVAKSKAALLWVGIVVGGMGLLHPFAFFYYLAFVSAVALFFMSRRHWAGALTSLLPTLLGLGLSSGPILHAVPAEAAISASYSIFNPAWTPVLSWTMTVNQAAVSIASRAIVVFGIAAVVFLVEGSLLLRRSINAGGTIRAIFGLWALLLFLLHENNPNGLFLVPFPLWYRVDPNRTFSITSLSVAVMVGLVLEAGFRILVSDRRFKFGHSFLLSLKGWRSMSRTRLMAIGLVSFIAIAQITSNAAILFSARGDSPVQSDDIQAFSWIRTHTQANATFFVNTADAGTWIPLYTSRRVVLPFGVITNYTLLEEYTVALNGFIMSPTNITSLQFMRSTGATYVYAGPGRIYDRPGFDPAKIQASGPFDAVYNGGSVWIFRLT
jgi:hypothetical protein